jgi:hypothetical protein
MVALIASSSVIAPSVPIAPVPSISEIGSGPKPTTAHYKGVSEKAYPSLIRLHANFGSLSNIDVGLQRKCSLRSIISACRGTRYLRAGAICAPAIGAARVGAIDPSPTMSDRDAHHGPRRLSAARDAGRWRRP